MNADRETSYTHLMDLSQEAKRLERQGRFVQRATLRFLETASITRGMKVLDVGSGAGDVALLLAELVGPEGTVVGVDLNAASLQVARQRVQAAGLAQVSFLEGDLATVALPDEFDAVVGRLILGYLPDRVGQLRRLLTHLRRGGIVAFQEVDLSHPGTTWPPAPLFAQAVHWIVETFRRAGWEIGLQLYPLFLDAGLPSPEMEVVTTVGGGPEWGGYEHIADLIRALLPSIVKLGITTEEEVEIETLTERLREEVVSLRGAAMAISLMSAWTRKA